MASSINPNNIDTTYPTAGRDNSVQGFHDNFTTIKTALEAAKDEIDEIHENGVFKNTVGGETLDNDMDGEEISNLTLVAPKLKISDHNSVASGVIAIDLSLGVYHKVTITGDVSLDMEDDSVPVAGTYGSFYLEVTVTGSSDVDVTWGGGTLTYGTALRFFDNATEIFTLPPGSYLYHFITTDGGTTWIVVDCLYNRLNVPTASEGQPGDRTGDFALDGTYFYLCGGDYDGSTKIWGRYEHSWSFVTW